MLGLARWNEGGPNLLITRPARHRRGVNSSPLLERMNCGKGGWYRRSKSARDSDLLRLAEESLAAGEDQQFTRIIREFVAARAS
jgi:hypothetical protein